jgi:hypothetical protein
MNCLALAAELQATFRRWAGGELGGAYLPETWQAVAARATELLKPGAQLQALRKRKSGGRNGGRPKKLCECGRRAHECMTFDGSDQHGDM